MSKGPEQGDGTRLALALAGSVIMLAAPPLVLASVGLLWADLTLTLLLAMLAGSAGMALVALSLKP